MESPSQELLHRHSSHAGERARSWTSINHCNDKRKSLTKSPQPHTTHTYSLASLYGCHQNTRARADLRENPHRQDHHARRGAERHDRQRETEDPGQGGHPARPAAPHLRGQAAGRWPHAERLQHPEGVDAPPRPALKRRPLPGALRHLRRPEARVGAPRGLRDDREGHGPDHGALRQDGRGPARHQPDDALGEHEGGALREDHRPRRELCGNQNPTARLC